MGQETEAQKDAQNDAATFAWKERRILKDRRIVQQQVDFDRRRRSDDCARLWSRSSDKVLQLNEIIVNPSIGK